MVTEETEEKKSVYITLLQKILPFPPRKHNLKPEQNPHRI